MSDEKDFEETLFTKHNVQEFMQTNNLDVPQMAELFGVTKQAIKYWMSGERNVPETTKRVFMMFKRSPELMRDF